MDDIDKIEAEFKEGVRDLRNAAKHNRKAESLLFIIGSMLIPMMKALVYIARK